MSPVDPRSRPTTEHYPGADPATRPTLRDVGEFDPLQAFTSEREGIATGTARQRDHEPPARSVPPPLQRTAVSGVNDASADREPRGPSFGRVVLTAMILAGLGTAAFYAAEPVRRELSLPSVPEVFENLRARLLGPSSSPETAETNNDSQQLTPARAIAQPPVVPTTLPSPSTTTLPARQSPSPDSGRVTTPNANVTRSSTAAAGTVAVPPGSLYVNARPWADVWVDGRLAGTTPLADLRVPLGVHEVVWRHPQLGERRQTVHVTSGSATRIGMDLRP